MTCVPFEIKASLLPIACYSPQYHIPLKLFLLFSIKGDKILFNAKNSMLNTTLNLESLTLFSNRAHQIYMDSSKDPSKNC